MPRSVRCSRRYYGGCSCCGASCREDRIYTVGASGDFATIADAIAAVNADGTPTVTEKATIAIRGYHLLTEQLTIPAYTTLEGWGNPAGRHAHIEFGAFNAFLAGGDGVGLSSFHAHGNNGGQYLLEGDDRSNLHIDNVGLVADGASDNLAGLITQSGPTWQTLLIEHDCLVDYRHTTGFAIDLECTAAATIANDVRIRGATIDFLNLASAGGGIRTTDCRDVWLESGSVIRGASGGAGAGVRVVADTATGSKTLWVLNSFVNFGANGSFVDSGCTLFGYNSRIENRGGTGTYTIADVNG